MKKKLFNIVLATVVALNLGASALAAQSNFTTALDVSGVTVSPLNGAAEVKWEAVDYDGTVAGYKVWYDVKPALKQGDTFESNLDVKNVTSYVVTGLTNDTKYYFAVTAYDDKGMESQTWSTPQASATPNADAGEHEDTDAPQVSKAETLNKEEVKVVFSEEVVLPESDPESAFIVSESDSLQPLEILDAKVDEKDTDKKTIILTTAPQTKDTEYELTASIDIQDTAGNPIISGTSDTAIFTGSDAEKEAVDATAPEVKSVETVDGTHILVNFSEGIVLSIDPSENFVIIEKADNTVKLEVLGVDLGDNSDGVEDGAAVITTGPQEKKTYVLTVVGVKDAAGNEVASDKNSSEFEGAALVAGDDTGDGQGGETPADLTPPMDVSKLLAEKVFEAEKYVVKLSWVIPSENLGDVVKQILYMSADKGAKYDTLAELEAAITNYDVTDLTAGEYWFKVTQKDAAGNESAGSVVKVVLAETGPEMLGVLAFSLIMGRVITKKKKK